MKKITSVILLISFAFLLFSCGSKECVHDWYMTDSTSTCYEGGIADYECARCHITKQEPDVPTHTVEYVLGHQPTCVLTGLTDKAFCGVCGEVFYEQELIPAYGHTYFDEGANTCLVCGYQRVIELPEE